jgi:hypothetical protein
MTSCIWEFQVFGQVKIGVQFESSLNKTESFKAASILSSILIHSAYWVYNIYFIRMILKKKH